MTALVWHDLLGTPWVLHGERPGHDGGMDCTTVTEAVLRRLGGQPPPSSPWRVLGSPGTQDEMATYLSMLDEAYERVGSTVASATRAGDIVLGADKAGAARHMYVLVSPERGTFLTSTHNRGVVACRGLAIRSVVGVYRLRGLPR